MMKTRSGVMEVAVNFALSWDARISSAAGSPANFSSPRDKALLLAIRATADAVMVGRRTVETDQMEMGLPDGALREARLARGQQEYPLRVLVSGSGRISPELKVFQKTFSPVLLFTAGEPSPEVAERATVHRMEGVSISPREILRVLAEEYGVKRLVCEGGAGLMRSLLEEDLVDEINLTFCPLIYGGAAAPTLTGNVEQTPEFLPASRTCRLESMEVVDGECFTRYRVVG